MSDAEGRTCAFADRVASSQNSRRPRRVALEHRCHGERAEREDECVIVMESANQCEIFAHDRNAFIGVSVLHAEDGTDTQRERQEPRTNRPSR